jgi:hypothetical protein
LDQLLLAKNCAMAWSVLDGLASAIDKMKLRRGRACEYLVFPNEEIERESLVLSKEGVVDAYLSAPR